MKDGWTCTKYIAYKKIKQNIIKECKEQNIKNWENKIKEFKSPITYVGYASEAILWKSVIGKKGLLGGK